MLKRGKIDDNLKILLLGMVVLCGFVVYTLFTDASISREKKEAIQKVTSCAEEIGLNDVSVELRKFEFEDKYWYKADVTCSNFEDFNPLVMLGIYNLLDNATNGLNVEKTFVSAGNIYSNGDTYGIITKQLFVTSIGLL